MDYLLKGLNDNRDYLGIDSAKEAVLVQLSHNTWDGGGDFANISGTQPGGDSHLQVSHPSMIVCHDKGAIFRLDSVN